MAKTTLTKKVVKENALNLLKISSFVTTLELKNKLRKLGYYAVQKDISEVMVEIAQEENLDHTNNGVYNTYYSEHYKGKKSTLIANSFDSKSNPTYNLIVDILCIKYAHLDSGFINGSDEFKFDLGLDENDIKELINEVENKADVDLSDININNINNIRDLLLVTNEKIQQKDKKSLNMISSISSTSTNFGDFYINSRGKKIQTADNKNTIGNWIVSSVTYTDVLEFQSIYTRDEVRMAYSKIVGTKFTNTRTKKIKK